MIRAVNSILPPDMRAGFFGKLPSRGDFVRENLPRDFTDPWDAWWQRGLAWTQELAGADWRAAWLEAPIWRFMLPPGLCGRQGVLGIWLPSVDKHGRYFPLTIAATATAGWAAHVAAMTPFLAAAEQVGCDALECDLTPAALLERIQDALMTDGPTDGTPDLDPINANWWTEGGARVGARVEIGPALPEQGGFAALIDEGWAAMATAVQAAAQPAISGPPEPN